MGHVDGQKDLIYRLRLLPGQPTDVRPQSPSLFHIDAPAPLVETFASLHAQLRTGAKNSSPAMHANTCSKKFSQEIRPNVLAGSEFRVAGRSSYQMQDPPPMVRRNMCTGRRLLRAESE